jgi:hypothetical protein
VYVDGDLLGGLDILKEMHASGDLEPILPKKQVPELTFFPSFLKIFI